VIEWQQLQDDLGHQFVRADLLKQALTHRSHSSPHNERLEFLGDSVLNCIMAALLYERFPELREGDLSRHRANLVRQHTLADIAQSLALGDHLRLGEGELKSGGSRRPSILADGLEAVIGAVFLDGGFDAARTAVTQLYRALVDAIDPTASGKDAKTELQELLQARKLPLPSYSLLRTRGEAHAQTFEVECTIPALGIRVAGSGSSRRGAEQAAAKAAVHQVVSR
jgi:ribonuclease-3